jgi:phosphatidylglycerol---prolipoprotein diacylglyceryl transferase
MPISPAYTLTMLAAVLTGVMLSRPRQQGLGLSSGERWGVLAGAFCGAMIGAKLPYVLSDWDGLVSGWAWFSDGKTILCGLAGGYFGVVLAKWSLGIHVHTGDSFAMPIAASIAVGRIGCFIGGCCYGTPTSLPWGVRFRDPHRPGEWLPPSHPTQLYEAMFHAIAAVVLWQLGKRGIWRGQLMKVYIIAYSIYRFFTEMIRPEARLWAGLTGYQWGAMVLALLFAWLMWRETASGKSVEMPAVSN